MMDLISAMSSKAPNRRTFAVFMDIVKAKNTPAKKMVTRALNSKMKTT